MSPGSVEVPRRDGFTWAGVVGIACAWSWLRPCYRPEPQGTWLGGSLLLVGALLVLAGAARRRRPGAGLLLAASAIACTGTFNELLIWCEAAVQPSVSPAAWLACQLVRLAGEPASYAGGKLLLQDAQGALQFAPTWGVIAFRPALLLWLAAALAVAPRAAGRVAALGSVLLLSVSFLGMRFAWLGMRYAAVPDVLAQNAPPAMQMFWEPWTVLLPLLAAAAVLAFLEPPSVWRSAAGHGPAGVAPALLYAALAGAGLGAALAWRDPGVPKAGRVLIDDRLTGYWEPAGRLLDTERYGDFSAYSFSAMVEHLSHRYSVWVNGRRDYTAEYLRDFDVLVLKTPEQRLQAAEIAAIRDWVRDGGGLFVISDHTNLLGMSTALNELIEPFGIQFDFDSTAAAADGGFDYWSPPLVPEHPASAGLGVFECMTPCSLLLSGAARPVMTLRRSASTAGDYSRASNFGGLAPNPAKHQGLLLLAAAAEAGEGRVLAFGDSTVLSSFAYYNWSHADFVARGVAWLNLRRSGFHFLGWLFLALGAGAGAGGWLWIRRAASPLLPVAAAGAVAAGFLAAQLAAGRLAASAVQVPAASAPRVGFVQEGGHVWLPAVLGNQPELPPHGNLMTFVQTPQRLGFETRIVPREAAALADLEVLVLLNPDVELGQPEAPPGWVAAVRRWVEQGGRLVVLARREHWGHEHDRAPLYLEGLHFHPAPSPAPEIELSLAEAGQGRVILVLGSEFLDVPSMGHCMQFPGRDQRRRYAAAYQVFGVLTGQAPEERRSYAPE